MKKSLLALFILMAVIVVIIAKMSTYNTLEDID